MCLKLLIIEDDLATIQSYEDNIESFNKKSVVKIEYTTKKNLAEAKKSLLSPNFDASIIDLKLSSTATNLEGLEIIKEIENNQRIPIYVVSGSIAQVENEESIFFKKISRDAADFQKILSEIVSIFQTGITKILGNKGEIEKYLSNIFWKHLSKSMEMWINDENRTPSQKQKSLLRHTISHMQEYIDEDIEKYHPSEFYITKPIRTNISTGDVISLEENKYIVLTPACDITKRSDGNRNATKILFCKIINLDAVIKDFDKLNLDTGKNNDNRKRLNSYIENKKQNYHFIPKSNLIDAGLIDFQDKITIDSDEVEEKLNSDEIKRTVTVSMPFLKDIISRHSSYLARQGSPDFDTDEIYTILFPKEE